MTLTSLFAKEFRAGVPSSHGRSPALIFLHGRGADENDLPGLRDHLDLRFHCFSVRAPFPFEFGGYTWYELLGIGNPEPKEFQQSYELLSNYIDSIRSRNDIDASAIYLFGFSMGSMMALAYALRHPDRVRGVVAHSGHIPEMNGIVYRWNDLASISIFVAHGSLDPVVPVALGRRARELLTKSNADFVYKEYPISHTIAEESLADISGWLTEKLNSSAAL
jgi:phospholipase/carboxylesterase